MFKELMPLLAERKIHILASATKEGGVTLYIEPGKVSDKEEAAFSTPFSVQATPEELDEKLPAILGEWIGARKQVCGSLEEALAASKKEMERQAEEAKKKAAERMAKKPTVPAKSAPAKATPAKAAPKPATAVVQGAAPSLAGDKIDEEGGEPKQEQSEARASDTQTQAAAPALSAAAVETGETVSLF